PSRRPPSRSKRDWSSDVCSSDLAVPSMFLDELPQEGIEHLDLSSSMASRARIMEDWRGGSAAADEGWIDAGVVLRPRKKEADTTDRKSVVEGKGGLPGRRGVD